MLKKLFIAASVFTLAACSTVPTQVNIVPTTQEQAQRYNDINVNLTSRDIRDANYLIAIHQVGDAAKLINNKAALSSLVETNLQKGWEQQGIVFADDAAIKVQIEVQVARVDIQQDSFEYEANSSLILALSITNEGKTLTKQFRSKSSMSGPFDPDIKDIEAKFAKQLSVLLQDIYLDEQVSNYLSGEM